MKFNRINDLAEFMGVSRAVIHLWLKLDPPIPRTFVGLCPTWDINDIIFWLRARNRINHTALADQLEAKLAAE